MTDVSAPPEMPDAAQTAHFLRRFADLMSNGSNATFLLHAAEMLEQMQATVTAARDEEQLWKYKYETMTSHTDMLEAECDSLKHDIEGHVNITSSILTERDTLKGALEERDAKLLELDESLKRERDVLANKSDAHEAALASLRASFELDRISLAATAEVRSKEMDQLRRVFEREREELMAKIWQRDEELSGLRDELTSSRADSERETVALRDELASLETTREELRQSLELISELRDQANARVENVVVPSPLPGDADAASLAPSADRQFVPDEASALVPKTTLRQAKAQFEYLAKDCTRRGDIATQVMCELGAYTLELALDGGQRVPGHLPVGEVALDILTPDTAPSAVEASR